MADTMSGALQLRSAVARKVYYEKYEGGQEEAAGEIIEEIRPETDRAMSRMITETNFNDGRMVTERAFINTSADLYAFYGFNIPRPSSALLSPPLVGRLCYCVDRPGGLGFLWGQWR